MRLMLAALAGMLWLGWGEALPAASADTFRVTLLGTGSPAVLPDRFGPSTLVEVGGQALVFDAGRGAPIRLGQANVAPGGVTALFITHFHSDHTSGIADLWLTGWTLTSGRRTTPLQVVGPTGIAALMANLERAYALDIETRVADENLSRETARLQVREFAADGVVYEKDGVRVTAFAVDHGEKIKPAFGYRIDYRGRSAVISGDTRYSENLIRNSKGVDLLIHEVMADPVGPVGPVMKAVIDHHTLPADAGRVFAQTRPKMAAYTHVIVAANPAVTPAEIEKATRATYAGPLEVGADLTAFEIGETVTVRRWGR